MWGSGYRVRTGSGILSLMPTCAGEDQIAHARQAPAGEGFRVWGSGSKLNPTCAGEDQISHAGQAPTGEGVGPQSHSQARHLCQAPGDQGCPRVVPKPQAVRDAAGDGQHILQRPPQLHSCKGSGPGVQGLGSGVAGWWPETAEHAEGWMPVQSRRVLGPGAGPRGGGRQSTSDFLGNNIRGWVVCVDWSLPQSRDRHCHGGWLPSSHCAWGHYGALCTLTQMRQQTCHRPDNGSHETGHGLRLQEPVQRVSDLRPQPSPTRTGGNRDQAPNQASP